MGRQEGAWRVGRWIPRNTKGNNMPMTFQDLAQHSRGDSRLAVLKADVDDMGAHARRDRGHRSFLPPTALLSAARLQQFFAEQVQDAAAYRWPLIYTLYAGGDDLLLVAPWQVMLDFAGDLDESVSEWPCPRVRPAYVERRYHPVAIPRTGSARRGARGNAPGLGERAPRQESMRRARSSLELGSPYPDHRRRQTHRGRGGIRR